MKNSKNKKTRGAALLMALLVVSLLSLASLAIGTVLVSEIRLTSAFRHKEEAFWAAEAGIEKGLWWYYFNRDRPELPREAVSDNNRCLRTILAERGNDSTRRYPNCREVNIDPNQRILDLRVYDQKKFNDKKFILGKDEGLTFRVNDVEAMSLNVSWRLIDQHGNNAQSQHDSRLYARVNCADGSFCTNVYSNANRTVSISFTELREDCSTCSDPKTLQLKAFIHKEDNKRMEVIVDSLGKYIGGPYIYIESVGYYKGVNKRLQVKLDREATTIYNILDYVIFSRDRLPAD